MKIVTPISMDDVRSARERIAPYLPPSALREYAELNEFVGAGIRVLVKHENQLPTNAFKVRNGMAAVTALRPSDRSRGVVCGTRGNHGLGVAYAGRELGVPVTVVVPYGNNPEKNSAMRGLGARVMECGANYDEAVAESERLAREEGMILVHSTNNRDVIAGAATLTLEILEQASDLDAMVIAVGGGSQAVGAITVLQSLRPAVSVYAVQAAGAPTIYESWQAGKPVEPTPPMTIADGVATGDIYELTFPTLRDGLTGFVLATEDEIIEATRAMTRCTHNLTEPAGAVGLAGLRKLRADLDGKMVCVILSGGNADEATLKRLWSN